MATKMSAEEKAVRDALAVVQADTGVQTASDLLSGKTSASSNPAPSTNTVSALAGLDLKNSPALAALVDNINRLQGVVTKTETILSKKAAEIGYSYDPNTSTVTQGTVLTVLSSSYSGTGKDRTRTDRMSDGSFRTFADPDPNYQEPVTGTTNVQALKAILKGRGIPVALVDNSATFLSALQKEGLDDESIAEIYLNNKDYTTKAGTTITSPFYSAYGFYNEGLTDKYTAAELYQTVEGYKASANKFSIDSKFTSTDYIQKYLKNNFSVKAFDAAANKARLADITADPSTKAALETLGFIKPGQGLTDYFLDPDVGIEKMQENANTVALTTEAIRRANSGIVVTPENMKKYGAALTARGLGETETTALASKAYETIAGGLKDMTKLSGIYQGTQAKSAADIQAELEQEQLQGVESGLRKTLGEQEFQSFQRKSGVTSQSLRTKPTAGLL